MRIALARALFIQPTLLLLDEPTNHLDMDSKAMLVKSLEDYSGTMIFVSHDRDFLSALSTHVLELDGSDYSCFGGGYDEYVRDSGHEAPGVA